MLRCFTDLPSFDSPVGAKDQPADKYSKVSGQRAIKTEEDRKAACRADFLLLD
jgi:hypothetical protein